MKKPVFQGSCTAMITPFTADGIDCERMGTLLDFQAENGTNAVLIAGTTGESATLEQYEYEKLVDYAVSHVAGQMKVIVGVGGNNTAHCAEKAKFAEKAGADATLLTAPYYNKTSQQGLISHFTAVADAADIPLILYNIPGRTSVGISAETYKSLSAHPNINGVKEASGDFSLISRISAECGGDLFLWSGNDDHTLPMTALGALGVISVASNLIPAAVAKLCSCALSGDFAAANTVFRAYSALFQMLFIETNPMPLKAAMALCGLDSGVLRLPLVPISPANLEKLRRTLQGCALLPQ